MNTLFFVSFKTIHCLALPATLMIKMASAIAEWSIYKSGTKGVNVNANTIGHFRVPPSLCFKTRVGVQPLIWKSFSILMQITHFHKKGCAPSLILKVRVFH